MDDSDPVTIELPREQAEWLLDAAERGYGEWGIHPDDAKPAADAIDQLRRTLGRD